MIRAVAVTSVFSAALALEYISSPREEHLTAVAGLRGKKSIK
jgi:hypothetical protein